MLVHVSSLSSVSLSANLFDRAYFLAIFSSNLTLNGSSCLLYNHNVVLAYSNPNVVLAYSTFINFQKDFFPTFI